MATATREVAELHVWRGQPKQRAFLLDYGDVFELLYGGAAGSGKSDALLVYQIRRRRLYPGTSGLFLRRTYPELSHEGGAIPRSHELLAGTGAVWNGSERKWRLPGGGALEFGHLQHEDDKHKYQSSAYADIAFDELTAFLEPMYLYLFSRARTTYPGCAPQIRSATNPGNVGHSWVKRRFIDAQPPLTVGHFKRQDDRDVTCAADDPRARSRAFVPARVADNRYLAATEYVLNLEALPDADRLALLHGDWDAWTGAVFSRWSRDRHVLRPFAIPPTWTRWCGLDWGTARPFVCLWIASGPRREEDPAPNRPCSGQHLYVYREFAKPGLLDEEMARAVQIYSQGERITQYRADPASFWLKSNSTGRSPALVFRDGGVLLVQANNDRLPGKRAVDAVLADCACGVPRLRAFETCLHLVTNLPSLPYSPTNVEDVDTDAADDSYDALRYALMGPSPRPTTTRLPVRKWVSVGGDR